MRSGSLAAADKASIDVSSLPNGQYYLHTTLDGKPKKQQVVISH